MSILHRYGESMGADVGGGGGSSYSSSSSSSTSYSSAPGGGGGDKYESVGGGRGGVGEWPCLWGRCADCTSAI